jgi:hypothetical protein
MDGKEYIIETLPPGSIINPTAFLVDDEIDTTNRAINNCVCYFLTID